MNTSMSRAPELFPIILPAYRLGLLQDNMDIRNFSANPACWTRSETRTDTKMQASWCGGDLVLMRESVAGSSERPKRSMSPRWTTGSNGLQGAHNEWNDFWTEIWRRAHR
jgi:hypothetical protein